MTWMDDMGAQFDVLIQNEHKDMHVYKQAR